MNNNGTEFNANVAVAASPSSVPVVVDSIPFCYNLTRVLLNSLLHKNAKEQEELQSSKLNFASLVADRNREVYWILMTGRNFHLGLSTLGCGIAILDRILRLVKVQGKYVHCVAVAALGLAVKFHEEVDAILEVYEANRETAMLLGIPSPEPMSADDLAVKIRENSFYSPQELNRMERTLLARLQWDLLLPSFDRFLQAMLAVIGAPHLAASRLLLRNYELIISSGELVWTYTPSTLALSLLSVMLEFSLPEWPRITESLRNIFQIDNICLLKCRQETAEVLRERYCWDVARCGGARLLSAPTALPAQVSAPLPSVSAFRKARKQRQQKKAAAAQQHAGGAYNNKHRRPIFGAFIEQEMKMLEENDGGTEEGTAATANSSTTTTTAPPPALMAGGAVDNP